MSLADDLSTLALSVTTEAGTLSLTPGPLYEEIPLEPGGVNAFMDANLPKSMQRAAPADPELSRFAETIAKQAAEELGMRSVIGLQWFTCEQSTRPTHWLDSAHTVGAHSRLDGFATAYQTSQPSIWLRLDGRRVPAAELAHLIRHEIAHLYLEIRGMPSGPVHEAMADTFADGGMPALEGAFGLGESPPALRPGNASSVVIIDGTSDMLKVATKGFLSSASGPNATTMVLEADYPNGLTAAPAHQGYCGFMYGQLPYLLMTAIVGGTPMAVADQIVLHTSIVSTNQTRVNAAWSSGYNRAALAWRVDFFIFKEAVI
jgi:hypothetical protein